MEKFITYLRHVVARERVLGGERALARFVRLDLRGHLRKRAAAAEERVQAVLHGRTRDLQRRAHAGPDRPAKVERDNVQGELDEREEARDVAQDRAEHHARPEGTVAHQDLLVRVQAEPVGDLRQRKARAAARHEAVGHDVVKAVEHARFPPARHDAVRVTHAVGAVLGRSVDLGRFHDGRCRVRSAGQMLQCLCIDVALNRSRVVSVGPDASLTAGGMLPN